MISIRKGTIKRLHVDKHVIQANLKHGRNDPAITVQTSKGPLKAYRVDVHGPSSFIYQPNKPLSCGARLWIETHAELTLSNNVNDVEPGSDLESWAVR